MFDRDLNILLVICHLQFRKNWELKYHKNSRSSLPEVFCKKGVLRNFAKFTNVTCTLYIQTPFLRGIRILRDLKYNVSEMNCK